MNKKFLLITRKFPPASGGGTPRLTNFATQLPNYGWVPTVITPHVPDGWIDREKEKLVKDVDVVRTGVMTRKRRNLWQKISGRLMPLDPHFPWAYKALKAIKNYDHSEFEFVFTSGPPHSVHYVGYKLAKKYKLKWIADFRDHYTLDPKYTAYSPWNAWIDKRFEQLIYKTADIVITNTRINRRDVIAQFPMANKQKLVTINNGFDLGELLPTGYPLPWSDAPKKKFNYLYLGGMYGPKIDKYFFDGLEIAIKQDPSLEREVSIRIVGDVRHGISMIKPYVKSGLITAHDPIPAKHIGGVLSQVDAGISWLPGHERDRGRIPQKFFEYLGTKTPVFFVGRTDGEVGRIVNRHQIGVAVDPVSPNAVAIEFLRFHHLIKEGQVDYSNCPSRIFDQFNRLHHVKKLALVFGKATQEPTTGADY